MDLLDAALGVLAVAAHVPLADRAVRARHGVGPADDPDDEVARLQPSGGTRVDDATERLVPEDETRRARRRPAVLALGDLDVGPADADRDRLDEDRALASVGLGHVLASRASGLVGFDRDRFHSFLPRWAVETLPQKSWSGRCKPAAPRGLVVLLEREREVKEVPPVDVAAALERDRHGERGLEVVAGPAAVEVELRRALRLGEDALDEVVLVRERAREARGEPNASGNCHAM